MLSLPKKAFTMHALELAEFMARSRRMTSDMALVMCSLSKFHTAERAAMLVRSVVIVFVVGGILKREVASV